MRRVSLAIAACCLLLAGCIDQSEARRIDEFRPQATASSVSSATKNLRHGVASSRRTKTVSRSSSPTPTPTPPPAPAVPPTELTVPILVYHHIRDASPYNKETWSYKMSVSPDVFKAQMQWLVDRGYTTISLDTLMEMRAGTRLGPTKPVVITFDDNQMSAYDVAVPILVANNQTAMFYLITNRLSNSESIGSAQIPDLLAKGMTIGSHTVTHSDLTTLTDDQLRRELADSRTALEAVTGTPVTHLAYPLTAQNQRVRDATAAAGYTSATVMDPRPSTMADSAWKLPRIMMTDDSNLERILP